MHSVRSRTRSAASNSPAPPDRLLNQEVAQKFFQRVQQQAQGYLSDEYFTVRSTLIEAWASQKSFQNTFCSRFSRSGEARLSMPLV